MKIFIIGGSGTLGSRLIQKLATEHQLAIFHRGNTSLALDKGIVEIAGDRNDSVALGIAIAGFAPDVVVDVILSSKRQAEELVRSCQAAVKRIVAISSCDVYRAFDLFLGHATGSIEPTPLIETSPLRDNYYLLKSLDLKTFPPWLTSDYEKIEVEKVIMAGKEIAGTIVRLPMMYGHGDVQKRFHEIFRWQNADSQIHIDQATYNWHGCWGCVDNAVEAIRLAVVQDRAAGEIYHVADLDRLSYGEILGICNEIAGWKGDVQVSFQCDESSNTSLKATMQCPSLNLAQSINVDRSKIERQLGFKPIVSAKNGLLQVLQSVY